jgi:hypothetical protein
MAETKTRPTAASVTAYIDALPDARMRADCRQLLQLMSRITGERPVLWGTSIVGFGRYHYVYASGNSGDWPLTGFAPRARDLTLYVMDGFDRRAAALKALGRHKTGKSCLYLKSLAEVDLGVLEAMLADSVQTLRARYPAGTEAAPASAAKKAPTPKTAIRQGAATTPAAGKPAAKRSAADAATRSARAKRR